MKKHLIERIPKQDVILRLVPCEQDAPQEEEVILLLIDVFDGPGLSSDFVATFDLERTPLTIGGLEFGTVFVVEVYRD